MLEIVRFAMGLPAASGGCCYSIGVSAIEPPTGVYIDYQVPCGGSPQVIPGVVKGQSNGPPVGRR